jgi:hypothetical protein
VYNSYWYGYDNYRKGVDSKTALNVERGKPQQQAVEVQNVGLAGVLVRRD